ncbi:MAG: LacI family DNA-binding transcriptional regulator [Clostridiales bacterium]|nr:LacI family DNA-binding transcriptional regulator [Clostridiales bacterium]
MKNKVTIKDVAQQAGVSVATVSYVINNKASKRISEKTRKRVLHTINLLNYTPNKSAQALATSKSSTIAIRFSKADSALKAAQNHYILNKLSTKLISNNFNTIYVPDNYCGKIDGADAIICYDSTVEDFHAIGEANFVPLIAVGCRIDDPLFFQINIDYNSAFKKAYQYFKSSTFTVACTKIMNEKLSNFINNTFSSIITISNYSDLLNLKDKNILIFERALYNNEKNFFFYNAFDEKIIETIEECIYLSTNRVPMKNHDLII